MGVAEWARHSKRKAKARDAAMPKHLDHGHVSTHRKNYARNHKDEIIKVQASDGHHWHMATDPASGAHYWFDEDNGVTTWTNPLNDHESVEDHDEHVAIADHTSGGGAAARNDGWEQIVDDASGTSYWWNQKSGLTQWDEPPASSSDGKKKKKKKKNALGAVAGITRKRQHKFKHSFDAYHHSNQNEEDTDTGVSNNQQVHSPQNDGVPAGWEAFVDPSSSKTYYVNASTGASSWVKPTSGV